MDVYIPIIRDSGDEKSPDIHAELKPANTFEDEIFRRLEEILQKKEGTKMYTKKQIEEMVKDLENHTCMSEFQAEIASKMLYIKGYRKANEVAREIFEEIEREIKNHGICYAQRKIAELKKKYTEDVK